MKNAVRGIAADEDIIAAAVELRRELHSMAELSQNERETKRKLMDFLSRNTSLQIVDMGAWFYAAYRAKNAGKRIAFRADMDALPIDEGHTLEYASRNCGVSHKCGHDGHSASLAAFAMMIDRYGSKNDVFFLFQHAEENGAGAAECEKLIALEHNDEIYGYHNMPGFPLGSVAVHTGVAACASTGMVLSFSGKNSHASQPENGINPAFACASLINAVPKLVLLAADHGGGAETGERTSTVPGFAMSRTGIVMCTVVGAEIGSREDGGGAEAFGTSAGFGRVMLTVRAEDESRLELLKSLLTAKAEGLAKAEKLDFSCELRDPFPETRNDALCAEKVRECVKALGLKNAAWDEPFRSSEDFGRYTKLTRGALFYIGCGEDHAPLHTADYDFEDAVIPVAAAMFRALSERD